MQRIENCSKPNSFTSSRGYIAIQLALVGFDDVDDVVLNVQLLTTTLIYVEECAISMQPIIVRMDTACGVCYIRHVWGVGVIRHYSRAYLRIAVDFHSLLPNSRTCVKM
jgi:hypothetical protein